MTGSNADSISACIEDLQAALRERQAGGQTLPVVRRKLRTLLADCGKRGTPGALADILHRFNQAGLYCEPSLTDEGLRLGHWVSLSTGPFPADSVFFPREADLRKFVAACLGSGVFRNLVPFKPKGRSDGTEYGLPDGSRIHLLCQERTKTGFGALVAIEFKRQHERGAVEQLAGYIDLLRARFPERTVKGIIVTGREDQVAAARLPQAGKGYDIRWVCYEVAFEELTKSVDEPEARALRATPVSATEPDPTS